MDTNRRGSRPIILANASPDEQIAFVLKEVEEYVAGNDHSWSDIAVVYGAWPARNFARDFTDRFTRRFGGNRLYWVTENRYSKRAIDVLSQTVKLSTIESLKGMEFRVVFLLGLEHLPRPDRSEDQERKVVYVGLTRAQDVLYVVGNEQKGYFGEICEAHFGQGDIRSKAHAVPV